MYYLFIYLFIYLPHMFLKNLNLLYIWYLHMFFFYQHMHKSPSSYIESVVHLNNNEISCQTDNKAACSIHLLKKLGIQRDLYKQLEIFSNENKRIDNAFIKGDNMIQQEYISILLLLLLYDITLQRKCQSSKILRQVKMYYLCVPFLSCLTWHRCCFRFSASMHECLCL